MDGRVPTFAITHAEESPEAAATRLGEAGFAVWHGNYYAVEVMKRLGLPDGAIRIGIVHYNTEDEVDRLLAELDDPSPGVGGAGRLCPARRRPANRVGVDPPRGGDRKRQQLKADDVDDRMLVPA